jgi:hypothetical protein
VGGHSNEWVFVDPEGIDRFASKGTLCFPAMISLRLVLRILAVITLMSLLEANIPHALCSNRFD